MDDLIRIHSVTKTFQQGQTQVDALRGVSAQIPEGAFSFVVGPSGSGKSTLLYLIGALDEPTTGEIFIAGRSLRSLTASERDRFRRDDVGFVFQSFNLLPNLTAIENVLLPYFPRGVLPIQRRRAAELLTRIGLEKRLNHRPSQLSGGEQQRIAVARALLKEPKLILADEPTGELDTDSGALLFEQLRQLSREQNTTVVVVTHDPSYITSGDRVLTLRDGILIKDECQ